MSFLHARSPSDAQLVGCVLESQVEQIRLEFAFLLLSSLSSFRKILAFISAHHLPQILGDGAAAATDSFLINLHLMEFLEASLKLPLPDLQESQPSHRTPVRFDNGYPIFDVPIPLPMRFLRVSCNRLMRTDIINLTASFDDLSSLRGGGFDLTAIIQPAR
jgi:hypothetical protein